MKCDVCVYGGTSGGVVAAVAAARRGRSVILVEPGRHVGGMTSGGLGWTDDGARDSIGGLARAFYRRVEAHYRQNEPSDSTAGPAHGQGIGWSHEPHVAEDIYRRWLEESGVEVVWNSRVASVKKSGARIVSLLLDLAPPDGRGAPAAQAEAPGYLCIEAGIYIDCSYEGDLMDRAGVSHTAERESQALYGESYAGWQARPYLRAADRAPIDAWRIPGRPDSGRIGLVQPGQDLRPGDASPAVQAYTFRLCMTDVPENFLEVTPPENYDPAFYEIWGRRLEGVGASGVRRAFYHFPEPYQEPCVIKFSPVPNGKSDTNQLDFVGGNHTYPNAGWAERARIWHAHEDYERGLLYFLRTDERFEPEIRAGLSRWGLAKDEFTDTGGWPHQLYVRESRRMIGPYVITQNHCERPPAVKDSVGLGSYSLDSHLCQLLEQDGTVLIEGQFNNHIGGSYPIPYRSIVPRETECENLLVTFCLSSSHVAYSSVRMEPVLMILGESAALAADLALAEGKSVQRVPPARLRPALEEAGQILTPPA